jgi:hypothetical protein
MDDIAETHAIRIGAQQREFEHDAQRAVIGMTIGQRRHRQMRRCEGRQDPDEFVDRTVVAHQ